MKTLLVFVQHAPPAYMSPLPRLGSATPPEELNLRENISRTRKIVKLFNEAGVRSWFIGIACRNRMSKKKVDKGTGEDKAPNSSVNLSTRMWFPTLRKMYFLAFQRCISAYFKDLFPQHCKDVFPQHCKDVFPQPVTGKEEEVGACPCERSALRRCCWSQTLDPQKDARNTFWYKSIWRQLKILWKVYGCQRLEVSDRDRVLSNLWWRKNFQLGILTDLTKGFPFASFASRTNWKCSKIIHFKT